MARFGQTEKAELVFRSNVTPEMVFDLTKLLVPGNAPPPPTAVDGKNGVALSFIRPEVIVKAFGVEKSVAPYGKPQTEMYIYVVGVLLVSMLLAGAVTFLICQKF